jgi:hypothetical protein
VRGTRHVNVRKMARLSNDRALTVTSNASLKLGVWKWDPQQLPPN